MWDQAPKTLKILTEMDEDEYLSLEVTEIIREIIEEENNMEKLKFNTVGQFLVALEEGPLYGMEDNKYTLSDKACKVIVVDRTACYPFSVDTLEGIRDRIYENTFTRQKPIPDKALVWCWDNANIACRAVRFYSAEDGCVFHLYGHRNGPSYDHYEVIEPNEQGLYEHPFDWANEAKKKLED